VARRSEVVADVGHILRPNCSRLLTSMKCMGSKKGDRGKRAGMVLGARQVAINSECPWMMLFAKRVQQRHKTGVKSVGLNR
jgi:hypothetical protein